MPRRKVAPTATVSKAPEDVEVIAVSADVHVSGQEQVASAEPPVGQSAIPKRWTGEGGECRPVHLKQL